MKTIEKIKEKISELIDKETQATKVELEEYERKIYDNSICYGGGGWNTQFEKAKNRREKHIEELQAIKAAQGEATVLKEIHFYTYYCSKCSLKIFLPRGAGEKVTCPLCEGFAFADGKRESMKIATGSRVLEKSTYGTIQLTDEGYVKE